MTTEVHNDNLKHILKHLNNLLILTIGMKMDNVSPLKLGTDMFYIELHK